MKRRTFKFEYFKKGEGGVRERGGWWSCRRGRELGLGGVGSGWEVREEEGGGGGGGEVG